MWKKQCPVQDCRRGAAARVKPFCFQSCLTPPRELGEGTREQSGFGFVEKLLCLPLRRKCGGEGPARAAAASPLSPRHCWGAAPAPPTYGRSRFSLLPAPCHVGFLLCFGLVLSTSIPTHWVPRWMGQEDLWGIKESLFVSIINPLQSFPSFFWCVCS